MNVVEFASPGHPLWPLHLTLQTCASHAHWSHKLRNTSGWMPALDTSAFARQPALSKDLKNVRFQNNPNAQTQDHPSLGRPHPTGQAQLALLGRPIWLGLASQPADPAWPGPSGSAQAASGTANPPRDLRPARPVNAAREAQLGRPYWPPRPQNQCKKVFFFKLVGSKC